MSDTIDAETGEHDWREAGDAWGHQAADWACLFEQYADEVITAIHQRVGIDDAVRALDIGCGSGLAIRRAAASGASMAGIDAAEALIEIARDRNPGADIRVGSMFELPWADESFDAITSINSIWGGCADALGEAHRVLRPGGRIGLSFWGDGTPNDLRGCFKAFARNAPVTHLNGMRRLNDIATPGVAEDMLVDAGFGVLERGARVSTLEWPDAEIAWRALASIGPAVPAIRQAGREHMKGEVLRAIRDCEGRDGAYRFRNDHQFVIAEKPSATS